MMPVWNSDLLLRSPLFEPLWPVIAKLPYAHFPTLADLNHLISYSNGLQKTHSGTPISFVSPAKTKSAKSAASYEIGLYNTGKIQTRADNWHDFLNAVVWLTFPKTKAQLNANHYRILMETGGKSPPARGVARDVLTLFDEGGIVIACTDNALSQLLRNFQWRELFWERREEVLKKMKFYLFGHAVYEKALRPHVGLTSKGVILSVYDSFFYNTLSAQLAWLDNELAAHFLSEHALKSTHELAPVPILGIPGWSGENENENYYANIDYFRPARLEKRVTPVKITV